MVRVGREREEKRGLKIESDEKTLTYRHVCIIMLLALVTSSLIIVVHVNLKEITKLYIF